jgi:hypothetical protein
MEKARYSTVCAPRPPFVVTGELVTPLAVCIHSLTVLCMHCNRSTSHADAALTEIHIPHDLHLPRTLRPHARRVCGLLNFRFVDRSNWSSVLMLNLASFGAM